MRFAALNRGNFHQLLIDRPLAHPFQESPHVKLSHTLNGPALPSSIGAPENIRPNALRAALV